MRLPRAFWIDLDDTILDDTGSSDALWRQVCGDAALQHGQADGERWFAAIDQQRRWYWSDAERHRIGRADLRAATTAIVRDALTPLVSAPADVAEAVAQRYRDLREQHISIFPGAREALEFLRQAGVKLAMLTNGAAAAQRAKIQRFDLARHFDAILIEGELGFGKPDWRVYEAAAAALRESPAHTWCIGDNLEWDVGAPQRAGAHGIWVDHRRQGVPATSPVRPDRIVHSLHSLHSVLEMEIVEC